MKSTKLQPSRSHAKNIQTMNINIKNNKAKGAATFLPLCLLAVLLLTGCNDFLDVKPKSQIEEEDLFSRESGYQDQLAGVYSTMSGTNMYGLQMTVGTAEVLSQNLNVNSNSTLWRYVRDYDYANSGVESVLGNVWSQAYNCIANLNIMLRNFRDDAQLSHTDSIYKGEALGMRAFLHLELMRWFAAAPAMGTQGNGVPYVTEYSTNVTGQKTVGETMTLIINDLLKARQLLSAQLNYSGTSLYNDAYYHRYEFNYYACTATLARAYLWNQDKGNALTYAQEIIDVNDSEKPHNGAFSWVHYSVFTSSNDSERQPSFPTEMIFYLDINDWEDNGNTYLHAAKGVNTLTPSYEYAQQVYELNAGLGADYRLAYGFTQDGEERHLSRLWHVDGRGAGNNMIPLIRMSEAYYIAAECVADSDPAQAAKYLNLVRSNRGLSATPLSENLTAAEADNEIYKEYRKEFLGEGQLFFYYKRRNVQSIPGAGRPGSRAVYVMPIPSNDQEFGGYTN